MCSKACSSSQLQVWSWPQGIARISVTNCERKCDCKWGQPGVQAGCNWRRREGYPQLPPRPWYALPSMLAWYALLPMLLLPSNHPLPARGSKCNLSLRPHTSCKFWPEEKEEWLIIISNRNYKHSHIVATHPETTLQKYLTSIKNINRSASRIS